MFEAVIPLMYIPGHWEIIIIGLAILLLFGGRKIPEMMRGLGSGIREFKKGVQGEESGNKSIPEKEEKPNEETKGE
ncbi:MAG TPA: twin-arginine translocase TatA/TatE family subunit [Bacteroidetes bacterium]|nr:twin-arginine translocase TatA/TatE family subunit [Bacteroidota bacterium]